MAKINNPADTNPADLGGQLGEVSEEIARIIHLKAIRALDGHFYVDDFDPASGIISARVIAAADDSDILAFTATVIIS